MGIDITALEILVLALKLHKPKKVLTIGRQGIHIQFSLCRYICEKHGFTLSESSIDKYCEKFFKHFGAEIVDSIDKSTYENATIIHDLNLPILTNNKYDFIYDGGSTEHIFNIAQVYDNIFELLEIRGFFCSVTPNNNQSGHGFY